MTLLHVRELLEERGFIQIEENPHFGMPYVRFKKHELEGPPSIITVFYGEEFVVTRMEVRESHIVFPENFFAQELTADTAMFSNT